MLEQHFTQRDPKKANGSTSPVRPGCNSRRLTRFARHLRYGRMHLDHLNTQRSEEALRKQCQHIFVAEVVRAAAAYRDVRVPYPGLPHSHSTVPTGLGVRS